MNPKNLAYGIIALVVVAIFFSGCIVQPPQPPNPPNPGNNATVSWNNSVLKGNNQFAADMYSQLRAEEGNVLFSPFSISSALTMTYEGARGQTAEEMASVLHLDKNGSARRGSYAALFAAMNRANKSYELKTANDLWIQKDRPLLESYMQAVQNYYGGTANTLDFKADPEGSRITINDRVENQTNGRIKDLIGPGLITPATRLVLTNAVYFKGKWAKPFDANLTEDENFSAATGQKKVPMMHMRSEFNYGEADGIQMLELPYAGDELSMLVLLPKEGGLGQLEGSLTDEKLDAWKQGMSNRTVVASLPKFKFETEYQMGDTLQGMGMRQAFSDSADFSGITEAESLKISEVVHKAFVEVNEEGTEAAAATAVIIEMSAMPLEPEPVTEFTADHPFIFVIQQKDTGNILFMGRVADPTAG